MSQLVNFSDLQVATSVSSGDQVILRKNNSLSSAAGFARTTFLTLEKSTTVYSTVNTLSTQIINLSSYWSGGANAFVKTYAELKTAVANVNVEKITLGNDIYFTGEDANIAIPRRCSINFNGFKFIKTGSTILFILGEVAATRVQVFSGWGIGDIRGTFKNDVLYPEWWGLQGSSVEDGRHDIAINSAIKTANVSTSVGRVVSLAAGQYYVGRPIEADNLAIRIQGAGSGATQIVASKLWSSDSWESSERFRYWTDFIKYKGTSNFTSAGPIGGKLSLVTPVGGTAEFISGEQITIWDSTKYNGTHVVSSVVSPTVVVLSTTNFNGNDTGMATPVTLDYSMAIGANNASSIIWIGGNANFGGSFWSGVQGTTIIGTWAVINNPTKRISAISWKASVEENTLIKDVDIQQFSGFGIGGGMYDGFNNTGAINTQDGGVVNGLSIENFWIKEATRKGALPIFVNKNTNCCNIRAGTIDCSTPRAATLSSVDYPYFRTWPLIGMLIYAGNGIDIESVHLEGVGVGIYVATPNEAAGNRGMVNIDSIESQTLMKFGMKDSDQLLSTDMNYVPLIPANSLSYQMTNENLGYFHLYKTLIPVTLGMNSDMGSYLFRYSTLVAIGTSFEKPCWDSSFPNNYFTNVNIRNLYSPSQYTLRDLQYGIDIAGYGAGYEPNNFGRNIAAYSRGMAFGLPSGTYPSMTNGSPFNAYKSSIFTGTWITNAKPLSAWDKTYYTLVY